MDFNVQIKGNTVIASIKGELDDHVAKNIREKLDFLLLRKEVKNIIFDLCGLTLMDSAGIGLMIGRYKTIKMRKGQALIVVGNSHAKKILKMSGMMNLFRCYETLDEALSAVQKTALI